ncbi:2-C-methyl-D-erythritol 2,4-cyclodiphosphate synthase, partial [Streptomyces caeruleatus]
KGLQKQKFSISHVAVALEGKKPHFKNHLKQMQQNVASILQIKPTDVGITATSGEGLTDYGCGDGVQCFSIITVMGE